MAAIANPAMGATASEINEVDRTTMALDNKMSSEGLIVETETSKISDATREDQTTMLVANKANSEDLVVETETGKTQINRTLIAKALMKTETETPDRINARSTRWVFPVPATF